MALGWLPDASASTPPHKEVHPFAHHPGGLLFGMASPRVAMLVPLLPFSTIAPALRAEAARPFSGERHARAINPDPTDHKTAKSRA